jgi:hypothetical protein
MRRHAAILFLLLGLLPAGDVGAQEEEERRWGVSPYIGLANPSLKELNDSLFKSAYIGNATLTDPTANNTTTSFVFNAPLPPYQPGVIAGLEVSWLFNDKNTLLFGVGNWNATSSANGILQIPIQGALETANLTRKSNISYIEYFLGWRHELFERPKKFRFYVSGTLHQVFDIEYREDLTAVFLSGDVRTFRKTAITAGNGTGLILLEGMGGAEWFLTERISLGLEGGYDLGLQKIELRNGTLDQDYLDTDNISLSVPFGLTPTGRVQYRQPNGDAKILHLDFSGWRALIKGTVYF